MAKSHTLPVNTLGPNIQTLLAEMAAGDELILAEEGRPVAVVTRSTPVGDYACEPGSAKGTPLWMAPDFDAPLDDFAEYME